MNVGKMWKPRVPQALLLGDKMAQLANNLEAPSKGTHEFASELAIPRLTV